MPQQTKKYKPWEVPIQSTPTAPDMSLIQRLFGVGRFSRGRPDVQIPFDPGQDEVDPRLLQMGSSGSLIDRLKFGQGMLKSLGAKRSK
jgi:hypothetical protein